MPFIHQDGSQPTIPSKHTPLHGKHTVMSKGLLFSGTSQACLNHAPSDFQRRKNAGYQAKKLSLTLLSRGVVCRRPAANTKMARTKLWFRLLLVILIVFASTIPVYSQVQVPAVTTQEMCTTLAQLSLPLLPECIGVENEAAADESGNGQEQEIAEPCRYSNWTDWEPIRFASRWQDDYLVCHPRKAIVYGRTRHLIISDASRGARNCTAPLSQQNITCK